MSVPDLVKYFYLNTNRNFVKILNISIDIYIYLIKKSFNEIPFGF